MIILYPTLSFLSSWASNIQNGEEGVKLYHQPSHLQNAIVIFCDQESTMCQVVAVLPPNWGPPPTSCHRPNRLPQADHLQPRPLLPTLSLRCGSLTFQGNSLASVDIKIEPFHSKWTLERYFLSLDQLCSLKLRTAYYENLAKYVPIQFSTSTHSTLCSRLRETHVT